MICLLVGHKAITIHGHGEREGRSSVICSVCGKIMDEATENQHRRKAYDIHVSLPARGYEAAANAHFAGKK